MLIHFIIKHQKFYVNIITNLIRKICQVLGNCQSQQWYIHASHILLFASEFRFYHSPQIVVLLEMTGSFTHFWENICLIPKSEKTQLSVNCSFKLENKDKNKNQLSTQTIVILSFFLEKPLYSDMQQSWSAYPHPITQNLKR